MNGFASEEYLEFSTSKIKNIHRTGIINIRNSVSFPYVIFKKNSKNYLITPIGFSGPNEFNENHDFNIFNEESLSICGGFLQTRNIYENVNKFDQNDNFYFYIDSRSNYRIDLKLSLESFLNNMNSTSRRNCKRFLDERKKYVVRKVEFNEKELIQKFSDLYSINSFMLKFNKSYHFNYSCWEHLLKNDSFNLFLLYRDKQIISGSIITSLNDGYDLTFTVNDRSFNNSGKATILCLFKYFKKRFNNSYIDLGGGVHELDELTRFKISMGGKKTPFKRLRFLSKKKLSTLEYNNFKNIENRWP